MNIFFGRIAFLIAFGSAVISVVAADRKDLSAVPAKIEVTGKSAAVNDHPGMKITVELRNPNNQPVPAPGPIEIELQVKAGNGPAEKSKLTIQQGGTSATIDLPVKEPGIVEVTATNPRLFEGGTLVEVQKAEVQSIAKPPSRPAAGVSLEGTLSEPTVPGTAAPLNFARRAYARSIEKNSPVPNASPTNEQTPSREPALAAARATPAPSFAAAAVVPAEGPSSATNWKPVFKLGYYPKQKFRAGDSAMVWASLQGDEGAPDDLDVTLMSDAGPLIPSAIKIPKGEHMGQGKLIATYVGKVNVWFDSSKPSGSAPDSMFAIDFGPPIWALNVVPTVTSVNLFDSTDVEVELLNSQGEPVSTDVDRQASLSFEKGSGALELNPVTIPAKASTVRTKFIPTSPGMVQLRVVSDGLPAATVPVSVTVPYLLILLCAVGSALGGLVAFWTESSASWHRIVIGLITGFVLYWAFLFGVLHVTSFAHAYIVNPFSAVILPFFGGWGGTKVITLLLKPLGLDW
ncbi:MAG TPA: hypothetical protein VEI58_04710 [Chthoniobacterales bacterium]|nr:hypothetical protein [Chthoniobacterales bacterium]